MVKIPYIKIPGVRVGSIGLTSNIGTGGATPAPPTPITYLTQWKIVGNSEVHGQEIWSCGEYSSIDGKYHILVQPLGDSIADIALDEPLRKVNDVADTIEFADGTAVVTRYLNSVNLGNMNYTQLKTSTKDVYRFGFTPALIAPSLSAKDSSNLLSYKYSVSNTFLCRIGVNTSATGTIFIYDDKYDKDGDATNLKNSLQGVELIYELATPITETIQAPQIQEADSYSCVISQGGKAVSWSSFETDSE